MGTVVTIDLFGDGDAAARRRPRSLGARPGRACGVPTPSSAPGTRTARSARSAGASSRSRQAPPRSPPSSRGANGAALSRGWFDPWADAGGVDPTGYVKGWAAQRALDVLASRGVVTGAIVNAAGDIATFGTRARAGLSGSASSTRMTAGAWPVLSRSAERSPPPAPTSAAAPLSTRGPGGRRRRVASASVTGPDLDLADALATHSRRRRRRSQARLNASTATRASSSTTTGRGSGRPILPTPYDSRRLYESR